MDWSDAGSWAGVGFKAILALLTLKVIIWAAGGIFTLLVGVVVTSWLTIVSLKRAVSLPGAVIRMARGVPASALVQTFAQPMQTPSHQQAGAPIIDSTGQPVTFAAALPPARPLWRRAGGVALVLCFIVAAQVVRNWHSAVPAAAPPPPIYTDYLTRSDTPAGAEPPFWARKNKEWLTDFAHGQNCHPDPDSMCAVLPTALPVLGDDGQPATFWVFLIMSQESHGWAADNGDPITKFCTSVYSLRTKDEFGHHIPIDPWVDAAATGSFDPNHPPDVAMGFEFRGCATTPPGL